MSKPLAPDPAIGTWKVNVSKSSFRLTPALKSETMKVEAWEDGVKVSADIVDAQANKLNLETAFKHDGKDFRRRENFHPNKNRQRCSGPDRGRFTCVREAVVPVGGE